MFSLFWNLVPVLSVRYNSFLNLCFVCPAGKPMIGFLFCCQGLAVAYYGFALDAAKLRYTQFSLN